MDYKSYSKVIDFDGLPSPDATWVLGKKIGEGTYGEVYSVTHRESGEVVAVKILENVHRMIEEVEDEYRVFSTLSAHLNLPSFHGLYLRKDEREGASLPTKDQLWIAMELCGGGSVTDLVKELISQDRRLPEPLLSFVLHETLQALLHLHNNKVIHRDVKGHNILLTSEGKVKLIDFGVSGHLSSVDGRKHTSVGTPFWMAPEVIACEQQLDYTYDVRCDVWSVGVTAIELAEGQPPFANLHPMRALFKIPRSAPPTLNDPTLWSDNFRNFISRCVVKDFEKRPHVKQLLDHPFFKQLPSPEKAAQQLQVLTDRSRSAVHKPYITAKHGQLRSRAGSCDSTTPAGVDDLATLENLTEETLVNELESRYNASQVYTYIGEILLAVNPFTPLNIYSKQWSLRYRQAARAANPPHIFSVADQSYQELLLQQHNQCIVISGESGAGKTESANLLVQQLTTLGQAANRTLEQRVLQVNPLMEAFGNAATVINDNSSRFGKYLEMTFTQAGKVTGAKITEYLLEKSRVVQQNVNETNFHMFYYIYYGLQTDEQKQKYHLNNTLTYRYLNDGGNQRTVSTASINRNHFETVHKCFEGIGFEQKEIATVYGILAAILHLGNIDFSEGESKHHTKTEVRNADIASIAASLLGVESRELCESLTTSGMVARGETIVRNHSVAEAVNVRDAVAKALYGRLFGWIVNRINVLLAPDAASRHDDNVVGILDIFGFENFAGNSFEQLCINTANEQIQLYFNQHIFMWEQHEYESEGVSPVAVSFADNHNVLDLLLTKPLGLFALLDEESNFPRATDQSLVEKFTDNLHKTHYNTPKSQGLIFRIKHYAGWVEYGAFGMLEKNRDRLAFEVTSLLRGSQVPLVKQLFTAHFTKTGAINGSHSSLASLSDSSTNNPTWFIRSASNSSTMSQCRLQQTVATYFRYSLMDLLSKLVSGTPHFVRCIRPNVENCPGYFDHTKILVQLRYTGVLETTRIRRLGFPYRVSFIDFVSRYKVLVTGHVLPMSANKESCKKILDKLNIQGYAIGHTKVFLKYYHYEYLCHRLAQHRQCVITAQACCRGWIERRKFRRLRTRMRAAAILIQKVARGWLARKRFLLVQSQQHNAAVCIQKGVRGFIDRRRYRSLLLKRDRAAVRIQAMLRGYVQRRKYLKQRTHTILVQSVVRRHLAQRQAQTLRMHRHKVLAAFRRSPSIHDEHWAATVLQKYFRMWLAQAHLTRMQLERQTSDAMRGTCEANDVPTHQKSGQLLYSAEQEVSEERRAQLRKLGERKQEWGDEHGNYYTKIYEEHNKLLWAKHHANIRKLGQREEDSLYNVLQKLQSRKKPQNISQIDQSRRTGQISHSQSSRNEKRLPRAKMPSATPTSKEQKPSIENPKPKMPPKSNAAKEKSANSQNSFYFQLDEPGVKSNKHSNLRQNEALDQPHYKPHSVQAVQSSVMNVNGHNRTNKSHATPAIHAAKAQRTQHLYYQPIPQNYNQPIHVLPKPPASNPNRISPAKFSQIPIYAEVQKSSQKQKNSHLTEAGENGDSGIWESSETVENQFANNETLTMEEYQRRMQCEREKQELDAMFQSVVDLYETGCKQYKSSENKGLGAEQARSQWKRMTGVLDVSHDSDSTASWDTALQNARERKHLGRTHSSDEEQSTSPQPPRRVVQDMPCRRDELHRETTELKTSLVQTLEVQQKTSLTTRFLQEEKRNLLQKARMQFAAVSTESTKSSESKWKQVRVTPNQPLKQSSTPQGKIQQETSDVGKHDRENFNFRSGLRKTNFDPEKTLRRSTDTASEIQQIDFRSVLKKKGSDNDNNRIKRNILVT